MSWATTEEQERQSAGQAKLREDRAPATRPNDVWQWTSFMTSLPPARKIRGPHRRRHLLALLARGRPESSAIGPRMSLRHSSGFGAAVGYPRTIRVDQGSDFVSRDLDLCAYAKGVTLDFSRPGKPTDNASSSLQRQVPERVPERALVPDACRRPQKDGGLAQILQRGAPAWGDRRKPPISLQNPGGVASQLP